MSRKSLILCLSALAAMVLAICVAVAFLYSGSEGPSKEREIRSADAGRCALIAAVPSDAVLAASFSEVQKAAGGLLSGFRLPSLIAKEIEDGRMSFIKRKEMTVSLHYSGKLYPLYLFEVGKAGSAQSEEVASFISFLEESGLQTTYVDCGEIESASSVLSGSAVVIASESINLVRSSERHIRKGMSLLDAPGFAKALSSAGGREMLFVSDNQAARLISPVLLSKFSRYGDFISSLSEWFAFDVRSGVSGMIDFAGTAVYDSDPSEFMNVLCAQEPGKFAVAEMLPSYTLHATSIAVKDVKSYAESYSRYLDSRQKLQGYNSRQTAFRKKVGMTPTDLMKHLEVSEIAKASFVSGSEVRSVNLMKVGNQDLSYIFAGTDVKSLRGYDPAVHDWAYPGLASSVFGQLYSLADESCFTYIKGWIVSGSRSDVEEYVSGKALEYPLSSYLSDAGCAGLLSPVSASCISYVSLTEAVLPSAGIFSNSFMPVVSAYADGCDCACAVFSAGRGKKSSAVSLGIHRLALQKTKAPVFERDTVVVVPEGPFKVTNSGTGKENLFYQNSHLSLCLKQDGKDLWGIPFKSKICGTVSDIDYYANGKIQFIFGAGKSIYVIDRLGRFVSGFPVALEKDILLGPELYDFNGTKKYNVMVLHTDKTIEMYNLKGQKPSSWKGIRAQEGIKGLPQQIKVGGNSYWVVRTSLQTLIYPFYGGDPLTVFEGDRRIRTDSEIKVLEGNNVEFTCYDGKQRKLALK